MNPQIYTFKCQTDKIYHENYIQLAMAIERSGGRSDFVLRGAAEFLNTLASNKICITAEHDDSCYDSSVENKVPSYVQMT